MTTPFHEIQFPPEISMGAQGGPGFKTTTKSLGSGFESRNQDWQKARGKWDVSYGLKTQEQFNELLNFFYARRGKAFGFRFKDWIDFKVPYYIDTPGDADDMQVIGTTDGGTTTALQVFKTYGDSASTYNRVLTKIVPGTFHLYNNGSLTTNYTINNNTGIVTLGSTLRATTGHIITCSGQFDVPCRFDIDDMNATIEDIENLTWPSIPVIELRIGTA